MVGRLRVLRPNGPRLSPPQQAEVWGISSPDQRVEKIKEILKRYPKQKHRREMLYEATWRGDKTLVLYLVQTGLIVHPNTPEVQGEESSEDDQERLESGSIPDEDDPEVTPVHVAASLGHLACVQIFMEEAEAEVDARDEFGRTPLITAYYQLKVAQHLLARGAEPTAREIGEGDPAGTPMRQYTGPGVLDYAAAGGGFESLELLLELGGYPLDYKNGITKAELLSADQKQSIINATPTAAERGDLESLKLLLSYQFPSDEDGTFSPFDVPKHWHKQFIYGLYTAMTLDQPEKFEFLNSFGLKEHEGMSLDKLSAGQNINIQHLLEKVVEAGSINCAKLMIGKYGVDPD
ncbi:ankyrin repeat-containing domain protein [Xylaria digitata]|nr:ankyrin repeat-containing domain protein [Xylaria digitata]